MQFIWQTILHARQPLCRHYLHTGSSPEEIYFIQLNCNSQNAPFKPMSKIVEI